ncbi:Lrp/AsnC family transcriptional regulator [Endozoicomonas sp. SM1973]|uniref:siroheme decarboxylase n=1 Tax=Spartinivicinus marinus TaxID=2994442 RepID=A0A853I778_9GAMM|nr:Lrp/AsnC family transcriptional regulator [Spartinivicinus marinus]MCX4024847.1 AsnC family protein [Spartinivicinus marinus]NYZ66508.1 Lrp/AsnC family transcriptional regulator [Spartinivicinus marinus]
MISAINYQLTLSQQERLKAFLEQGLPFEHRPFKALAEQLQTSEQALLETVQQWQQQGLIRRFGLVIRHHGLGYHANAMVVWDINDEDVERAGEKLANEPAITLCYQRKRQQPEWPYNLFCMIHGKEKQQVLNEIKQIIARHQLQKVPYEILFSNKVYKQRGGRYSPRKS